jgi:hypothetical protein
MYVLRRGALSATTAAAAAALRDVEAEEDVAALRRQHECMRDTGAATAHVAAARVR